jgi:hypothetical protein
MRVIIICGDRNWTDHEPITEFVATLPSETVVISGGARGADSLAHEAALARGLSALRMDAAWKFYGARAGPVRNARMLHVAMKLSLGMNNRGPISAKQFVEVHAFHDHIAESKGTANMLSKAKESGVASTLHQHPVVQ